MLLFFVFSSSFFVYNSRRILITKFEMVSNQIAVVNVYAPAGSQDFFFFFF